MKKLLKSFMIFSIAGLLSACSFSDLLNIFNKKPEEQGQKEEEKKDDSKPEEKDINDGRELIEDQLYTDDGLTIEFNAKGARISKMY